MADGPILFCWAYRIEGSWGEYFGDREEYLRVATQLEFLLEFNSWLGISPEGKNWLEEYKPNAAFAYYPDIARADLNSVVPLAERVYEALQRSGNERILADIMIEKMLLDVRLKLTAQDRTLLLAAYMDYFSISQTRTAHRMGRFPHMVNWGDKISALLKAYREKKEKGTLPPGLSFLPLAF